MPTFEQKIKFLRLLGYEIGVEFVNEAGNKDASIRDNGFEFFVSQLIVYWPMFCVVFFDKCVLTKRPHDTEESSVLTIAVENKRLKVFKKPNNQSMFSFVEEFVGTL